MIESKDGDRERLLAAIGRALRLKGPFRERPRTRWWDAEPPQPPTEHSVEVLNGVVDSDHSRVAWVERHTFPPDGDGEQWVNVWLRVAGKGVQDLPRVQGWVYFDEPGRHISVRLTEDRADRVSGVSYLRFLGPRSLGDALVVVFREGSNVRLCRLTLGGVHLHGIKVDRVELGRSAIVMEPSHTSEVMLYHLPANIDDHELLLYPLHLPDLVPRVPIPVPEPVTPPGGYSFAELRSDADAVRWVERVHDGRDHENVTGWRDGRAVSVRPPSIWQRGFVADPEFVWRRLRNALAGRDVPEEGPDILIGAVARPFWDASAPSGLDSRAHPLQLARGPWWFPAAWHRFLCSRSNEDGVNRPKEAAAWLRWLDRLATEADPVSHWGWEPEWSQEEGIARLALIHLRRQARSLAAACRAGDGPPRLGDWRLYGPLPITAYPAGFARAWRRLPDRFRPGGTSA